MFRRNREPKRLLPKPPNRFVRFWKALPSRIRDGYGKSWREQGILWQARKDRLMRRLSKKQKSLIFDYMHWWIGIASALIFIAIWVNSAATKVNWEFVGKWFVVTVILLAVFWISYMFWKRPSWRANSWKYRKHALRVAGALLLIFGIYRIYRWSEAREIRAGQIEIARAESKARQEAQRRKERAAYAAALDSSAIVLPVCDTSFTIMVGKEFTPVIVPPQSVNASFSWRRVNPGTVYAAWTPAKGEIEFWPGEEHQDLGLIRGIRFRTLGEPAPIYVHLKETGRACRWSAPKTKLPARAAGSFSFSVFSQPRAFRRDTVDRECRRSRERG